MKIRASLLAVWLAALGATTASASDETLYFRLPATHFYDRATVADDELEPAVVVSTEPGWKRDKRNWLAPGIPDDFYLRAFVHKKTGVAIYQVVVMQHYYADTWRQFEAGSYATPEGPVAADVKALGNGQVECGSRLMGCRFIEHVGFQVPESLLQALASAHKSADPPGLRFKVKSRSGHEYVAEVSAAEIAATLARATELRLRMTPATAAGK